MALNYAISVIGGRWVEAEPFIMLVPTLILPYATEVIKGRWHEAESHLVNSGDLSRKYAKEMIKLQIPLLSFVE
jgi:hypothetical protein